MGGFQHLYTEISSSGYVGGEEEIVVMAEEMTTDKLTCGPREKCQLFMCGVVLISSLISYGSSIWFLILKKEKRKVPHKCLTPHIYEHVYGNKTDSCA